MERAKREVAAENGQLLAHFREDYGAAVRRVCAHRLRQTHQDEGDDDDDGDDDSRRDEVALDCVDFQSRPPADLPRPGVR